MTMVSTREAPWQRLGKLSAETLTLDEALHEGGLDFTVSLRDIRFNATVNPDADPTWTDAPHRKMVVADDTDEPFDVVSADYGVLQYAEAAAFLAEINPRFVAAGTLKARRQGFVVVQLPDLPNLEMLGFEDPHELFIVVRTSHDRTRAVECAVMPLRGRCMNELALPSFTRNAPQRWSVHHVGDVKGKLIEANRLVDNTTAYVAEFVNTANRLYEVALDTADGERVLRRTLRETPRRDETVGKILDMWQTRETVGFVGSGWGLVNAVSEYFEWERAGGTAQSQLLGALEGPTRRAIDTVAKVILSGAF